MVSKKNLIKMILQPYPRTFFLILNNFSEKWPLVPKNTLTF